jgi:hypothetical protein
MELASFRRRQQSCRRPKLAMRAAVIGPQDRRRSAPCVRRPYSLSSSLF